MVNIVAVIVCAVVYMIGGYVWYGPLFGKNWAQVIGMDMSAMTPEKKKEMSKQMWPTMFLNFIVTIVMMYVLALFVDLGIGGSGIVAGIIIWIGFLMPMAASGAMWGGKSKKLSWQMFWLTAGYQLLMVIIAGWILSVWR